MSISAQSEQALAGALAQWPSVVLTVCEKLGLTESSFNETVCRTVFTTVARMATTEKAVTIDMVLTEMGDDISTVAEYASLCPSPALAEYHIGKVREAEQRRNLSESVRDIGERLAKGGAVDVLAEQLKAAGEAVAVKAVASNTPRPYTTRAWDELAHIHLVPPMEIWGGWVMGAACVVFGQGGLGKSRVALNLARNQVLGLPFAGLPTAAKPLRHLFMGSENSIHRLQYDVRRMNAGLSAEQVATLGQHIRMATLEGPEDTYISMNATNAERWRLTVEAHKPDVLWVDPWGDVLEGESNSDEDARATISALRRILRGVNPEAGLCILAHSRTGASNILQAVGYDAANFGKGSKALYSAARCVWNLAPGDESEEPPLVMVHAKSNDSKKHPPLAVRLDSESMTYNVEEGFSFEQWQADLSASARGKRGPKKGTALTEEQAIEAVGDRVGTSEEVNQILRDKGATRDAAADIVKRLILDGRWDQWRPPMKNAPNYIGTPEAIRTKRKEVSAQLQRKLGV